jgi:cytochrome oxidase assembly protein ShyY1
VRTMSVDCWWLADNGVFPEGHVGDAAMRISKGIPVGRPPTVDLRNAHMSYVITW